MKLKASIIERLEDARVVEIERKGRGFRFRESCDRYFEIYLTRAQLLRLIDELTTLANENPNGD